MSTYGASSPRLRALAVILLTIGLTVFALLLLSLGSMLVRDADGIFKDVILRGSERRIVAAALPAGLHASTTKLEGEAVVRCSNGKEISLGYVTGGWHIRRTVHAQDCSPSAPVILNS